jgi:hypothetical protein
MTSGTSSPKLDLALIISRQIDYLAKMSAVSPKPVHISEDPREMLRYELDEENELCKTRELWQELPAQPVP